MKFELPIASPPFTSQELEECGRTGECCQCGMCCIAYSIDAVPSEPGNPDSLPVPKPAGQPCPQLAYDDRGRAICQVQGAKSTHDVLATCSAWQGNVRVQFVGTLFADLESVVASQILHPHTPELARLYERAESDSRLTDDTLESVREYLATGHTSLLPERSPRAFHPLVEFLMHYLTGLQTDAPTLFRRINVGTLIQFLWPTIESQLRTVGLHPDQAETELLRTFWSRYHSSDPSPAPCPHPSTTAFSERTTSVDEPGAK